MIQNSDRLYSILESFLGSGKLNTISGEAVFFCPNCHHRKRKLCINVKNGCYHCWTCDLRGRNIANLIIQYGNPNMLREFYEISKKFLNIVYDSDIIDNLFGDKKEIAKKVDLPPKFRPIWEESINPNRNNILRYLRMRGIKDNLIRLFNIGWSDHWKYENRVIIPSYNMDGELNYYISRTIYNDISGNTKKYLNCETPWSTIIPFELYVNWNRDLTIVEGVFDFMKHVDNNVIPLLGNNLSSMLLTRIIKSNINVYVMLDSDMRKKAIDLCTLLSSFDIKVYFSDMERSGYKDPSEIGEDEFLFVRDENLVEYNWELLLYKELEGI